MTTPAMDQMIKTVALLKNNTDPARREELNKKFWHDAVECFNQDIAGTFTTAHGVTVTTQPLVFKI